MFSVVGELDDLDFWLSSGAQGKAKAQSVSPAPGAEVNTTTKKSRRKGKKEEPSAAGPAHEVEEEVEKTKKGKV